MNLIIGIGVLLNALRIALTGECRFSMARTSGNEFTIHREDRPISFWLVIACHGWIGISFIGWENVGILLSGS